MRFVREEFWYRLPLAVRILLIPFLVVGGAVGYILYALLFPLIAVVIIVSYFPRVIRSYRKRKYERKRIDDALKRAYLLRDRMTDDEIVEAFTSWGVFRDPTTARVTITRFLEHCNKSSAED